MRQDQQEYLESLDDGAFAVKFAIAVANTNQLNPLGSYIRREMMKAMVDMDVDFLDDYIK